MNYYLGIDAGGSKTIAVITDESGTIISSGMSGCGNHQVNVELARTSITESVDQALQGARLSRSDIAFASFGLAGADREADYVVLRPMIKALGFANYEIVCDTVIGLRAGTRQPYGVVLICGTGTNCSELVLRDKNCSAVALVMHSEILAAVASWLSRYSVQ